MPYTAVKAKQRRLYATLMRQMLLLMALVCLQPTSEEPQEPTGKRGRFTFEDFEAEDRAHRGRDGWLAELAEYAGIYQGLAAKRRKRHALEVVRKDVRHTDWDEGSFRCTFRFERDEFPFVLQALRVRATIKTHSRFRFTGEQALLIYLHR